VNVRRWWPPIAWAVLVLLLNSVPGGALPSGGPSTDKGAHFVLYAILGVLAARAALRESQGWRPLVAVLLVIVAFGAADELHQALVPGRSVDVRDWIADLVGATAGVGGTAAVMHHQNTRA
jgi:VanZ family protein